MGKKKIKKIKGNKKTKNTNESKVDLMQLISELDKKIKELKTIESEFEANGKAKEVEKLSEELNAINSDIENKRNLAKLIGDNAMIDRTEELLSGSLEKSEELNSKILEFRKEINEKNKEITDIKEQIKELAKKEISQEFAELKTEQEIQEIENEIKRLNENIKLANENIEKINEEIGKKNDEIMEIAKAAQLDTTDAKSNFGKVIDEKDALNAKKLTQTQMITSMESELKELNIKKMNTDLARREGVFGVMDFLKNEEAFFESLLQTVNDQEEIEKPEEPKNEEPKNEEPKNEEPKNEEPKNEEPKNEEPKNEEPKNEESKNEEPKNEEPKNEEPKNEEPKNEEIEDVENNKKDTQEEVFSIVPFKKEMKSFNVKANRMSKESVDEMFEEIIKLYEKLIKEKTGKTEEMQNRLKEIEEKISEGFKDDCEPKEIDEFKGRLKKSLDKYFGKDKEFEKVEEKVDDDEKATEIFMDQAPSEKDVNEILNLGEDKKIVFDPVNKEHKEVIEKYIETESLKGKSAEEILEELVKSGFVRGDSNDVKSSDDKDIDVPTEVNEELSKKTCQDVVNELVENGVEVEGLEDEDIENVGNADDKFKEIDTDKIPPLMQEFLLYREIMRGKQKLDHFIQKTISTEGKYTGKKGVFGKLKEMKMRFSHRRSKGKGIFSSLRKLKNPAKRMIEMKDIRDKLVKDSTSISMAKFDEIETPIAKKYFKGARDNLSKIEKRFNGFRKEEGIAQHDYKLAMIEEYEEMLKEFGMKKSIKLKGKEIKISDIKKELDDTSKKIYREQLVERKELKHEEEKKKQKIEEEDKEFIDRLEDNLR